MNRDTPIGGEIHSGPGRDVSLYQFALLESRGVIMLDSYFNVFALLGWNASLKTLKVRYVYRVM